MEKKSILRYFDFGSTFDFIRGASADYPLHGKFCLIDSIEHFLNFLSDLELVVTDRASYELRNLLGELKELPQDATLSSDNLERLRAIIKYLEKVIGAEIQGLEAYTLTPKTLDINKLTNNVEALFAPNTFSNLPEIARYDFMEAGKCIAFERSTAAAFHILRGTEEVLKHFYCSQIRQKRIRTFMWGPMVTDLRSRPKTAKHTTLYNNLDNIRVSFRNPTAHPEKIYDIYEVQDLWSLCVEATNRMIRILNE